MRRLDRVNVCMEKVGEFLLAFRSKRLRFTAMQHDDSSFFVVRCPICVTAIRLHGSYSTDISVSLSNKKESAPVKLILSHVLVADEHVER